MSLQGISDVCLFEGTESFDEFIRNYLVPIVQPFNWISQHLVVIMDNTSIYHVETIVGLIENQIGACLHFLPPYSPDLNPVE